MVDKMDEECPVCGADSSKFLSAVEISKRKREQFELFLKRRDALFGSAGNVDSGETSADKSAIGSVLADSPQTGAEGHEEAHSQTPNTEESAQRADALERAEEAYQRGKEYMESGRKWLAGGHRPRARDFYQRAFRYFERALRLNPDHEGAKKLKSRCLGKMV